MKNFLYIMALLLTLTSCKKFLEPQSQTEYVPKDANSLNEMLLGNAYLDPGAQNSANFAYNEIFSDDWAFTSENCINTNNANKYPKYKPYFAWHPNMFKLANDNVSYQNVWKTTYQNILGCNAALDYIDKVTGTTDDKNYIKGQSLALRAFYYFNLVNLFGEPYNVNKNALGVPLKLNSGLEEEYLKRATVEEVYNQIKQDLDVAEASFLALPTAKQFIKNGRVTLPMVQLMKARVALFTEDYDQVIVNSNKVIANWGLSLLDLNGFTATTAAPYYLYSSYNNPEALWLFGSSYDFNRFSTETLYLLPTTLAQSRRMFSASPELVNSFSTDDLRKNNYILKESPTISGYTVAGKLPVNANYLSINTEFGRALRLSEAYLMLSEAYYFKGRTGEAVTALETLRKARFKTGSGIQYQVPVANASGTALLTFIKEERRREMCFEGLRWFDQRRWGMESFSRTWKEEGVVINTFTMEKNDPAFTLPIPFDAIEKNPNLVQNKLSNPKY